MLFAFLYLKRIGIINIELGEFMITISTQYNATVSFGKHIIAC